MEINLCADKYSLTQPLSCRNAYIWEILNPMKAIVILFFFSLSFYQVHAQSVNKSSHYLAAEKLLLTINTKSSLEQSISMMLKLQTDANPQMKQKEEQLKGFFTKYLGWEALKDELVALYTNEFSEAELKDLTAFYNTPTGKKISSKQGILMQKGATIGQEKVKLHMGELQEIFKSN